MDVRCTKCGARHEVDEALLNDVGNPVHCTACDRVFHVPSAFSAPLFSETSPSIRQVTKPAPKSSETLGALYDSPTESASMPFERTPGPEAESLQAVTMRFSAFSPPNDTIVSAPVIAPRTASTNPPAASRASDAQTLVAYPIVPPVKAPPKRFEDTIPVQAPREIFEKPAPQRRPSKLKTLYRASILLVLIMLACGIVGWFLFPVELRTLLGL